MRFIGFTAAALCAAVATRSTAEDLSQWADPFVAKRVLPRRNAAEKGDRIVFTFDLGPGETLNARSARRLSSGRQAQIRAVCQRWDYLGRLLPWSCHEQIMKSPILARVLKGDFSSF